MRKSFKFKLYNNKKKNNKLNRVINICSGIWNFTIDLHKTRYEQGLPYLHKFEVQRLIVGTKKTPEKDYWSLVGSQAAQDIAERIDKAYQRFFSWAKTRKGPKMLPPKFKSARKYKSFTLKQAGWKLDGNRLRIGGVWYRFFKSREIDGDIKTVTIKRDAVGDLWVIFSCDNVESEYTTQMSGNTAVGGDFGLKTFLTLSDCTEIKSLEAHKSNITKIKRLSRLHSKKQKGSNNKNKARINLARLHRKVVNHRKDYHWKLARYLVVNYDIVCLEDLNLTGMTRMWGRKMSDIAFGDFVLTLKHVFNKEGKTLLFVDRRYPSTKTCFDCGFINKELTLNDREWTCPECGVYHDRDLNASWNILAESGRAFPDRLENVRPLYGGDSWLTLESHML
jgi:putative transposase